MGQIYDVLDDDELTHVSGYALGSNTPLNPNFKHTVKDLQHLPTEIHEARVNL